MTDERDEDDKNQNLLALPVAGDTPISPAQGVAAIAMNFALKYADVSVIKDGVMYQQRKMEGANIAPIDLEYVFDVAKQIERHLVLSERRVQALLLEMLDGVFAEEDSVIDAKAEDQ